MKYLLLFVFLSLMVSCSSTKKITSTSKSSSRTTDSKIIDSVTTTNAEMDNVTDSIYMFNAEKNKTYNDSIVCTFEAKYISMHFLWNNLLEKYVNENGIVDYIGFKKNRKVLKDYLKLLSEDMPEKKSSKELKLAYWINAYNAMTVDLILRHYPIKSIKDIKNPWKQRFWKLGEKWYNLDDIEHQILRKMDEPRIHFAIVCASYSCPKLQNRAFVASKLEAQLTQATKEFLSDSERNSISKTQLELSKIFQWFAKDFKQNGSLIDFLNQYYEVKVSNTAKVRFKDYNWDLND